MGKSLDTLPASRSRSDSEQPGGIIHDQSWRVTSLQSLTIRGSYRDPAMDTRSSRGDKQGDPAGDFAWEGWAPVPKQKPHTWPGAAASSPISCLSLFVTVTAGHGLGEEPEASFIITQRHVCQHHHFEIAPQIYKVAITLPYLFIFSF